MPDCTALGGMTKDGDHSGHDMRLRRLEGDHDHDHDDMEGAKAIMCPVLTQLFNVEDKYLEIASCSNTTFTYNSCSDEEGTDCTEEEGDDFLTLLNTKNDMGNCYRVICSSETEGVIGHFQGPCDAINMATDFDMYCEPHHACALFDNSEVGGDAAAATTAAMALAATALAFVSLM